MSIELGAAQLAGRLQQTPTSPVTVPAPRRSRWRHLARWVSPVVIIGLWQILSSAGVIDERTIASPAQIAVRAVELVQDGTLGSATLVSLQRVALGFLIGGVIGSAWPSSPGSPASARTPSTRRCR